jgi:hypothetical protein
MLCVVNAVLLFLHSDLGRAADLAHGNTASELHQTFLQLSLAVVAGGILGLRLVLLAKYKTGPSMNVVFSFSTRMRFSSKAKLLSCHAVFI